MEKTSPKDVFLHILSIVALYVSAGAFLALLFQYVNIFFPDPLAYYYDATSSYSAVRWAIATLIVVSPAYIWSVWFLNKIYLSNPQKRNLQIRKWLIYFTLFVAALILMGDVVALIYNFLNGDLTVRFLLKVLSVLFVSSSVFNFYFWDIRNSKAE